MPVEAFSEYQVNIEAHVALGVCRRQRLRL